MKKVLLILLTLTFVIASCGTSKGHCDAYGDLNIESDTTDLASR